MLEGSEGVRRKEERQNGSGSLPFSPIFPRGLVTGKVTLQAKVLAAKPDDLSSIAELPQFALRCAMAHVSPPQNK